MQVTEIQHVLDLERNKAPRSPGLHVSAILGFIARRLGILKREDEEEVDWTLAKYHLSHGANIIQLYPEAIYRVALGLAFEDWYGPQHPHHNYHAIGELEADGIIGTPDGIEFSSVSAPIVHEYKLTWKSSRSGRETPAERIAQEWMWTSQAKSYCYQASVPRTPDKLITDAMLHVYWVNGNYRGSGPQLSTYYLKFSMSEIVANWRLITETTKREHLKETQAL